MREPRLNSRRAIAVEMMSREAGMGVNEAVKAGVAKTRQRVVSLMAVLRSEYGYLICRRGVRYYIIGRDCHE